MSDRWPSRFRRGLHRDAPYPAARRGGGVLSLGGRCLRCAGSTVRRSGRNGAPGVLTPPAHIVALVDPKRLVREGYERAASEYEAWSDRVDARPRSHYLTVLADLVEPGAKVLELGCGTGLATSDLAKRFDVVGVDFSAACLERARETTSPVCTGHLPLVLAR